jgi:hypothetical protein
VLGLSLPVYVRHPFGSLSGQSMRRCAKSHCGQSSRTEQAKKTNLIMCTAPLHVEQPSDASKCIGALEFCAHMPIRTSSNNIGWAGARQAKTTKLPSVTHLRCGDATMSSREEGSTHSKTRKQMTSWRKNRNLMLRTLYSSYQRGMKSNNDAQRLMDDSVLRLLHTAR